MLAQHQSESTNGSNFKSLTWTAVANDALSNPSFNSAKACLQSLNGNLHTELMSLAQII
jgi:hypothetical protein